MVKNYIKRNLMLLGAAAIVSAASAATYQDVTGKYIKNPAFLPGWQGALTATADGVAEVYNGAFNLYQTLNDMPAGEYTLKVNAFYRCGNNDFSKANMTNGKNHYAYIYINGEKKAVEGLFDNNDPAPNSTSEANTFFEGGKYLNEVKFNLTEPGDLVVGIMNEGGYGDEWCCFDNFQLFCGSEDVTSKIINADFSQGLNVADPVWDLKNSGGENKKPDVNKGGGVYRKTNASPYNFGQQVELPAGKYRFSVLSFLRYGGAGNYSKKIITVKGQWGLNDVEKSPLDWYQADAYADATTNDNAYLYMAVREKKPTKMTMTGFGHQLNPETDKIVALQPLWEIWEGDYAAMPENETRGTADFQEIIPPYETRNVVTNWCDSGMERESSASFVANPDKYRTYLEFELAATTKVWLGLAKDANAPAQYWNPFADFKLEQVVEGAGVDDVVVDEADENAPVEYYNLQGVRVENPANGLYIKVQGKKATKVLLRN